MTQVVLNNEQVTQAILSALDKATVDKDLKRAQLLSIQAVCNHTWVRGAGPALTCTKCDHKCSEGI